jgi:hypothetical protein
MLAGATATMIVQLTHMDVQLRAVKSPTPFLGTSSFKTFWKAKGSKARRYIRQVRGRFVGFEQPVSEDLLRSLCITSEKARVFSSLVLVQRCGSSRFIVFHQHWVEFTVRHIVRASQHIESMVSPS